MQSVKQFSVPELEFLPELGDVPKYKHVRILPMEGTADVTLSTAGGGSSSFQVPNDVFNLSRSFLQFTLQNAAGAATHSNYQHVGTLSMIRECHVYLSDGTYIVRQQNVNRWLNLARFYGIPLKNIEGAPKIGDASARLRCGQLGLTDLVNTDVASKDPANVYVAGKYDAPRHYIAPKLIAVGAALTALTAEYVIPMSEFLHSFLEIDKSITFDRIAYLKFIWAPTTDIAWDITASLVDPITGAAAATALTLQNVQFYLAVEQNQNIRNQIINKVRTSALNISTDWVYDYKNSNTGASQTTVLRFNRSHGKALRRVFTCLADSTSESNNFAYDINAGNSMYNGAGSPWTGVVTPYVNGQRACDFDLTTALEYNTRIASGSFDNSLVSLGIEYYKLKYAHIDSWDSVKSLTERSGNREDGLDLSTDTDYTLQWNNLTNLTYYHYQFAVVSRTVSISSAAVVVM